MFRINNFENICFSYPMPNLDPEKKIGKKLTKTKLLIMHITLHIKYR